MAKKRILKKLINASCQDLAVICVMLNSTEPETDTEKMYELAKKALKLQKKTVHRISFAFDKSYKEFASRKEFNSAKKKYFASGFKTMNTEFQDEYNALVKELNSILPKPQMEEIEKAGQEAEKQA